MNKEQQKSLFKHITYSLVLLVSYILQTTPHFLEWQGTNPMFVFPIVVAIAMLEGETVGGIYGAAAGLLCDMSSYLFFGFYGIFFCIAAIAIALMVQNILQVGLVSYLLYIGLTLLFILFTGFIFLYGIWHLDSIASLLLHRVVLVTAGTVVVAVPYYYILRGTYQKFNTGRQKKGYYS